MSAPAMPPKIKVQITYSHLEYDAWFVQPMFEPYRLFSTIESVYAGLKPLNISPGDVRYQGNASTPTDALVVFQLAKNQYALSLSLAGFTFKADNVDWNQAPIISNIIQSTAKALADKQRVEFKNHQLQLVMQAVLPLPLKEFGKSFAPMIVRPAGDIEFSGLVLHTRSGAFFVDKSVVNENGIFVRIVTKFDGNQDINGMAKVLYDEEAWLAATLGIEFD